MTQEDWLLLEALISLVLPVGLVGTGIAFVLVSVFHNGDD